MYKLLACLVLHLVCFTWLCSSSIVMAEMQQVTLHDTINATYLFDTYNKFLLLVQKGGSRIGTINGDITKRTDASSGKTLFIRHDIAYNRIMILKVDQNNNILEAALSYPPQEATELSSGLLAICFVLSFSIPPEQYNKYAFTKELESIGQATLKAMESSPGIFYSNTNKRYYAIGTSLGSQNCLGVVTAYVNR